MKVHVKKHHRRILQKIRKPLKIKSKKETVYRPKQNLPRRKRTFWFSIWG